MLTNVGTSVVRCPSRDHISKTKQDSYYGTLYRIGPAYSVAAFGGPLHAPLEDILVSNKKMCKY